MTATKPVIDRDVRTRHHFHACMKCGNIWDHDPPGDEVSKAEFKEMHTCAICRNAQHCDIAAQNTHEAEELATKEYITWNGSRYYPPDPQLNALAKLLGMMGD